MDDKTRDLILELTSGALPVEEAARLEASLSPEELAELEAHRAVLAIIAAQPPASLTGAEQDRLSERVTAAVADTTRELNAVDIVQPALPRPRFRWAPLVAAASAVAVIGAVFVTGTFLNAAGDEDSTADVTLAATTTIAIGPASAGAESMDGSITALRFSSADDRAAEFLVEPGATVNDLREFLTTTAGRESTLDPDAQPCAAEARSESGTAPASARFGIYEETTVIAFTYPSEEDVDEVLLFDAATCKPVAQSSDGRLGEAPSP